MLEPAEQNAGEVQVAYVEVWQKASVYKMVCVPEQEYAGVHCWGAAAAEKSSHPTT